MEREKERQLFYIQLEKNFFRSGDSSVLREYAEERGIDTAHLLFLYLCLILEAIESDGIIQFSGEMTPLALKGRIGFRSDNGLKADLEFIDEAVQLLEELQLVEVGDRAIRVVKALNYTMNFEEQQEKIRQSKRKTMLLKKEFDIKKTNTLSSEEKEERLLKNRIENEWIPGLIYSGFCTSEESGKYQEVFDRLFDSACSMDEISGAMKRFIQKKIDLTRIIDKVNYLEKTLFNIVEENRFCPDEYNRVIELMQYKGFIGNISEIKDYVGIFLRLEKDGYSKSTIAKTAINVLLDFDFYHVKDICSAYARKLEDALTEGGGNP